MQNAKVDRNLLVWLVATFFLATVSLAEAQQAKKVARIGSLGNEQSTASEEAFLQGLREREWIEGQNIVGERRYWENRADRPAAFVDQLVRFKVAITVPFTGPSARAAKKAISPSAIVM